MLTKHKTGIGPKRAAELTHNMYEVEYTLPQSKRTKKTILKIDAEQQKVYEVVHKLK